MDLKEYSEKQEIRHRVCKCCYGVNEWSVKSTDDGYLYECEICGSSSQETWSGDCRIMEVFNVSTNQLELLSKKIGTVNSLDGNNSDTRDSFINLLYSSRHSLNFVTYNIDSFFLGVLSIINIFSEVRGIVGKASDYMLGEIERSGLQIMVSKEKNLKPHQKLVILDGVCALTGSANLSLNALTNVALNNEIIDTHTNFQKVEKLNNSYFSKHFSKFSSPTHYTTPLDDDDVPF